MQEARYQKFLLPVYLSVVVETFGSAGMRVVSAMKLFKMKTGGKVQNQSVPFVVFPVSENTCLYL